MSTPVSSITGAPKSILLNSHVGWQAALLGNAAVTGTLAIFAPSSLTADLLSESGAVGSYFLALFIVCFVLSATDLLVNDILPEGIKLDFIRQTRPYTMLYLGVAYVFLATASTFDPGVAYGGFILITGYMYTAFGCVWWSVAHTFQRMQSATV